MEKYYNASDMVKISCNNCEGCSACCRGMGQSIILNPYDVYRLSIGLDRTFQDMLSSYVELHVEQGIILPNMKMQPETQSCGLLDENGRCSLHVFRPGLCRLFPLGRNYENHRFQYFVVEDACPRTGKTKVKISKWLEEPQLKRNEEFITEWHYFIKDMQKLVELTEDRPEIAKNINMLILQEFFMTPYDLTKDFYSQYELRRQSVEEKMKPLSKM